MGSLSNRSRRYSEEFKRDAVALVRSSGRTVTEAAREIGVSAEGLRNWSNRTRPTAGRGRRASLPTWRHSCPTGTAGGGWWRPGRTGRPRNNTLLLKRS
ncbi:transposase [Streptomyces sp. PR69]|uniref:transposase n=1 Tax=Streptomyces sp. PR69 TaxID=2984950 RepID=UPI003A5BA553